MLPGIVAAPFSIIASVLSDTNATDISQVFNESNVTAAGNFTFEPTTFLFVNYLKQLKDCENDTSADNSPSGISALHMGPGPVILSGSQASSVFGSPSPPSASISGVSTSGISSTGFSTSTSTFSASDLPSGATDTTASNSTDDSGASNSTSDSSVYDAMALYNSSTAMQLHINMTLPRPVAKTMPLFAINGTYDSSQAFVIGIFNLGNSTFNGSAHAQYIGANFTAQNIATGGSELSLLTNSSEALIEYWRLSKKYSGTDDQRLVFLIWNQTDEFNSTFAGGNSSNSSSDEGSSSLSSLGGSPTAGNWSTSANSSISTDGSDTTGTNAAATSLDLGNGPTAGNWSPPAETSTGSGMTATGTSAANASASTDTLTSETNLSASSGASSSMTLSNLTGSRFEFSISEFIELSGLGQPIGGTFVWVEACQKCSHNGTDNSNSRAGASPTESSTSGNFALTGTDSGLINSGSTDTPTTPGATETTGNISGSGSSSKASPTTVYVTNY